MSGGADALDWVGNVALKRKSIDGWYKYHLLRVDGVIVAHLVISAINVHTVPTPEFMQGIVRPSYLWTGSIQ